MGCASITLRFIRIAPASLFIIGGGHNSPLPMKAQFNYTAYQSWQGKCYALFLKLKAIKSNGIYYNFSYKRLCEVLCVSQSSLRKYLPILFEKGLVRLEHGHLHVVSYETFHKSLIGIHYKHNQHIPIYKEDKLKDIIYKLQGATLAVIQGRQQWCHRARRDAFNCETLKQHKSGKKRLQRLQNPYSKELRPDTIISVRYLARMYNISTTSVWRYLNILKKKGFLDIEPLREIVWYYADQHATKEWMFPNDGYYFLWQGCLYKHMGSKIKYKEIFSFAV